MCTAQAMEFLSEQTIWGGIIVDVGFHYPKWMKWEAPGTVPEVEEYPQWSQWSELLHLTRLVVPKGRRCWGLCVEWLSQKFVIWIESLAWMEMVGNGTSWRLVFSEQGENNIVKVQESLDSS